MQEKTQNFSPIKQRILQYVDYLGITKREFYRQTGISRGTLESNSGITEEIINKFLAVYKEISLYWLIHGSGEMIHKTKQNISSVAEPAAKYGVKKIYENCEELRRENYFLKKEIELKDKIIKLLENK